MKLIICEKPSLAQNVCAALRQRGESFTKDGGASVGKNFVVIAAFGHLFGLANPEQYKGFEDMGKWTLSSLPFFPSPFEFAIKDDGGVKKQFACIKSWIFNNDISEIINCGDSDREGEIIVRLILQKAGNKKPVKRLWIQDQTESTILKGLKEMKDDSAYDSLANEGFARMYMDWLYGINLTRYATIKNGGVMRIGRVLGAIVKAVYDRDTEIKNFVPKQYLIVSSKEETNGAAIELNAKKQFLLDERGAAEFFADALNKEKAVVTNIKTDRKTIGAPKLFSQSGIQNVLSKRYQFPPDKTLALVQSLYEKGLVSYPRTPTEYLATAEKDKANQILTLMVQKGETVVFKDKKSIFDDSKIESHSAITPTTKLAKDNDFASKEEEICYKTIYNRFCAVFCVEDCLIDQTVMTIAAGEETFTLKGNVSVQTGWKKYEAVSEKETVLPALKIGDAVNTSFKPVQKETKPPKHYTVETMNNYLKNPFKDESKKSESDDEEYKNILDGLEIGTVATRAGILENAIRYKYIKLEKTNYLILPDGERLVYVMNTLTINMSKERTAEFGKYLKDIYKGTKSTNEVLGTVETEIAGIIKANVPMEKQEGVSNGNVVLGKCPKCGKDIVSGKFGAYCTGKCGMNVSFVRGKSISDAQVKSLLAGKKILIKGLTSKAGKKYDAYFTPKGISDFSYISKKDGKEVKGSQFDCEMSFPEKKGK